MKYYLLAFWGFMGLLPMQAQTKRVLFIGNSYTYYNNLPQMLNLLANSNGDTVVYDSYAPGGYTFQGHSGDATVLNKIRQGNWDYVVLQEQSQRPSFPPSQVQTQVYPFAERLDDSIKAYNACATTLFYMTWGRQNGDASNCANYPPLCTYEGMQQRLYESYLEMTQNNDAACAPVGAAWRLVRQQHPWINLYDPDGSHPSYAGSYLAACVFYASIFRESPVGLSFRGSLADSTASRLQLAAASVVLDSLRQWQIGIFEVQAAGNVQVQGDTVQFGNQSRYANGYRWYFGDGQSSTQAQPLYVYADSGNYQVLLVAYDSLCGGEDSLWLSVRIEPRIIQAHVLTEGAEEWVMERQGLSLGLAHPKGLERVRILDLQGRVLLERRMEVVQRLDWALPDLGQGLYVVQVSLSDGRVLSRLLRW